MESQKSQYEDPALSKQTKIIHFSSGETLELEDSEAEEEQSSSTSPFAEPTERVRHLKNRQCLLSVKLQC